MEELELVCFQIIFLQEKREVLIWERFKQQNKETMKRRRS